ncbi:hypothetical protein RND71_006508 [Anisodus tanguticus]|uniref:Uncharacterized protein n=1 Tax=Anisodus tanguticus TaxID=243964 RepID=A0AAE1SW89_9SOLA|nr:hypothetical protein RND71_006508 [Anisodus tanguticus]
MLESSRKNLFSFVCSVVSTIEQMLHYIVQGGDLSTVHIIDVTGQVMTISEK